MWAVIVFLTIGLYNMFKNPQSNIRGNNKVIFSAFLTAVDNGEVVKVEIQGNNIKGTYSNGNNFTTYSPNDPNSLVGVYYLRKPTNSGNLIIEGEMIDIQEDDIIFFNDKDIHWTQKNKSNEDRITISFNML